MMGGSERVRERGRERGKEKYEGRKLKEKEWGN